MTSSSFAANHDEASTSHLEDLRSDSHKIEHKTISEGKKKVSDLAHNLKLISVIGSNFRRKKKSKKAAQDSKNAHDIEQEVKTETKITEKDENSLQTLFAENPAMCLSGDESGEPETLNSDSEQKKQENNIQEEDSAHRHSSIKDSASTATPSFPENSTVQQVPVRNEESNEEQKSAPANDNESNDLHKSENPVLVKHAEQPSEQSPTSISATTTLTAPVSELSPALLAESSATPASTETPELLLPAESTAPPESAGLAGSPPTTTTETMITTDKELTVSSENLFEKKNEGDDLNPKSESHHTRSPSPCKSPKSKIKALSVIIPVSHYGKAKYLKNVEKVEEIRHEFLEADSAETATSESSEVDFTIISVPKGVYPTAESIPIEAIIEECHSLSTNAKNKQTDTEEAPDKIGLSKEHSAEAVPSENDLPEEGNTLGENTSVVEEDSKEETNHRCEEASEKVEKQETPENLKIPEKVRTFQKIRLTGFLKSVHQTKKLLQSKSPEEEITLAQLQLEHEGEEIPLGIHFLKAQDLRKPFLRYMSEGNNRMAGSSSGDRITAISCPNTSRLDLKNLPKLSGNFSNSFTTRLKRVTAPKAEDITEKLMLPKLKKTSNGNEKDSDSDSQEKKVLDALTNQTSSNLKKDAHEIENCGEVDLDTDEFRQKARNKFRERLQEKLQLSIESLSSDDLDPTRTSPTAKRQCKKTMDKPLSSRRLLHSVEREFKVKPPHLHSILSHRSSSRSSLDTLSKARSTPGRTTPVIKRKIEHKREKSQTARSHPPTASIGGRKWNLISTFSTSENKGIGFPKHLPLAFETPTKLTITTDETKVTVSSARNRSKKGFEHATIIRPINTARSVGGRSSGKLTAFEEDSEVETVRERRPTLAKEDLWWTK